MPGSSCQAIQSRHGRHHLRLRHLEGCGIDFVESKFVGCHFVCFFFSRLTAPGIQKDAFEMVSASVAGTRTCTWQNILARGWLQVQVCMICLVGLLVKLHWYAVVFF